MTIHLATPATKPYTSVIIWLFVAAVILVGLATLRSGGDGATVVLAPGPFQHTVVQPSHTSGRL